MQQIFRRTPMPKYYFNKVYICTLLELQICNKRKIMQVAYNSFYKGKNDIKQKQMVLISYLTLN